MRIDSRRPIVNQIIINKIVCWAKREGFRAPNMWSCVSVRPYLVYISKYDFTNFPPKSYSFWIFLSGWFWSGKWRRQHCQIVRWERIHNANTYNRRGHTAHAAEDKNVRTKHTIAFHRLDVNERQRGITNERLAYLHHKYNKPSKYQFTFRIHSTRPRWNGAGKTPTYTNILTLCLRNNER